MLRDVTREVRLEQMRKDFVANASHELRSPLTVVAGYLETFGADPGLGELLGAHRGDAPPDRSHDPHHRGPARAVALRGERRAHQGAAHRRRGDGGAAAQGRARAAQCIRARSKSASNPRRRLIGDEAMVQSAFSNLVDNAAKYTPADGSVHIRWWTDDDGRAFLRARHRPGHLRRTSCRGSPNVSIASIRAARARPAARAWGSPSSNTRLHRHGARLEIESIEGRGSTFTCHFPRERVLERRVAASA